jgi:hypothetical protein
MQFDTFLFDAFSQLSGGLITDLKTLLLGMLLLGMILMGADMLFEKLGTAMTNRAAFGHYDAARKYFDMRNTAGFIRGEDSFEFAYYNSLYQKHMSASASGSFKTGKHNFEPLSFGGGGLDDIGIERDEEESGLVKSDTIYL